MKTILAVALATVALLGFTSEVKAGPGHHHGPSWGYHSPRGGHCGGPVYKIRTVVICSRQECRTGYYPCGRPYTYRVTVVTYRDIFSNGTSRTYTRTLG